MTDDFILFGKIQNGDIEAFEQLFRRYHVRMCAYAAGITGRFDTAEDAVQDVFYGIWKNRANLHVSISASGYLYRAVRNQSLRYIEEMQIGETPDFTTPDSDNTPQEQLEYAELERIIEQTIAQMTERMQHIFGMYRNERLKYAEIANRLNVSVKTVEADMTKAYAQLRRATEKYLRN